MDSKRRLIREDGGRRVYRFARGKSRDLTPEVLARQLDGSEYVARGRRAPITRPG